MEFKGKYSIPAPPDVVWAALHEPEMLAAALPGCEAIEKLSDTDFKARATIKVGPVEAHFEGKIQFQELPPPEGIRHAIALKAEGQAGAAGFARVESQVRLSAGGDGTLLEYDASASIGGRLAQVGQRPIDSAAKTLADEFFAKFSILMRAQMATTIPPARTEPARHAPREEGLGPQVWVVGLIGIVIILLIVFSIVF
jgi:hypothetical protein